ncbi:MAG: molecular chaperone DnaK [Verrucomicrobiota bacterium]
MFRQLPISQPQIDATSREVSWNDSPILPSTVWLAEGNSVFTGALCVDYADIISEHAESRVVHGIKSELANRHWALTHNGEDYRPAEISSIILRTVWNAICAENFPEINGIVITIPSSFSSTMRRETLRAARMAGLPMDRVSLLDEPIAALFSEYSDVNVPFKTIHTDQPILVFDMGGGTVDVTVLKIRPTDRVVNVLSTSRYNQVAGDDLDLEIATYLWQRLHPLIQSVVPSLSRTSALALLRAGEALKLEVNKKIEPIRYGNAKDLCAACRKRNDTLTAAFDLLLDSTARPELSIPIADILDLVLPFIARDEVENNYERNIFTPIRQALESAGLEPSDISQVYLVGGGANFQPVYLELRSYFYNLSRALDATYAVSAGAARFAAAAHSGWRVSETTSERIYVRRDGESFLEVLPDKLPVPSQPMAPPRPLEGNDTIEMQEESRYLRLEFFKGSQVDDPQMSPVYTATLRFQKPLRKATVVHSLVGRIDENKIYRFEIGLTEPSGRKVSTTLEFSADSDTQLTPDSGPRYQLNSLTSLAEIFQREPLRKRLTTRIGSSRVSFVPSSTPASVMAQATPMESLLAGRNAILRAMNESWADAYIGDKYLPTRLRATLAELQRFRVIPGVAPIEEPHLELVDLYKLYDVTVIRSLLDHSFLLYGTRDLEGKFGPIVDALAEDLAAHPERVPILLAELNQNADSAFDVTRKLVEIFLGATQNVPRIDESILQNPDFSVPFKFTAAKLLGNLEDVPLQLLKLLKQLGNRLNSDEFDWKARPIIAALAETGTNGFKAALDAFDQDKLGHAGPLVLGSFGMEFGKWAVEQKELPARYVPALFQALLRIRSRTLVDQLVFRLLDEWYCDPEVAQKVNEGHQRLQSPKVYEKLTNQSTRNLVASLGRGAPARKRNLTLDVREAAVKRNESYLLSLQRNEALCNAIADALVSNVDDLAAALLIDFSTKGNERFRRILLGQLLRRHLFKRLNVSRQRLILEWPITKQMASIQMLERILEECEAELHPFVNRMIFEKNQAARQ